jgi:threonine aldolase
MRFISAQFEAYLAGDLWLRNAEHANRMAALLADGLRPLPGIAITRPVQTNMVWASLEGELCDRLRKEHFFYVLQSERREARFVASFDTTEADVRSFVSHAASAA